jgi:hypothetical protein
MFPWHPRTMATYIEFSTEDIILASFPAAY